MKFSLSITWLIVAAILNPLCCCLAVASENNDSTPVPTSCCSSSASEESETAALPHECSHQVEKEHKPFDLPAGHSPSILPTLGLWMGLVHLYTPTDTPHSPFSNSQDLSHSNNSPPGNYQLLCTYLI